MALKGLQVGSRLVLREVRWSRVSHTAALRQLELGKKRRRGTRVAGSKVKWR